MPYKINRIENFPFISIDGEPDESGAAISIDSWGGVNGMDFTDEGQKAIPFSVFTLVDCNDLLMADVTYRAYKQLQGQGSVAIVRNGELLTDRFKVLLVVPVQRAIITTAVGNKLSAQSGAILRCRWDLVACPP